MNKQDCLNFVKNNLENIQKDKWYDICISLYMEMCTPDDAYRIFSLIEGAGISIPEEDLSNFLINYLNDMILEIGRSSIYIYIESIVQIRKVICFFLTLLTILIFIIMAGLKIR